MAETPAAILYDVDGNPVTVTLDAGVRRVQISGKVAVVGAQPPPATTPVAIFADTPLVVGTHDVVWVIPEGETFYLQEILGGNEDPTKGAKVEVIFDDDSTERLITRMYLAGFSNSFGFADIYQSRDGTPLVGNAAGTKKIIVRRTKFSGTDIAIDAVARGYY